MQNGWGIFFELSQPDHFGFSGSPGVEKSMHAVNEHGASRSSREESPTLTVEACTRTRDQEGSFEPLDLLQLLGQGRLC